MATETTKDEWVAGGKKSFDRGGRRQSTSCSDSTALNDSQAYNIWHMGDSIVRAETTQIPFLPALSSKRPTRVKRTSNSRQGSHVNVWCS